MKTYPTPKHGRLSKFGAERAEYLRSARAHTDLSTRAKFVALARSAHRDLMRERLARSA
jgi:hypothetical protein